MNKLQIKTGEKDKIGALHIHIFTSKITKASVK